MNRDARKIAVCFFGITRSLRHTIASIEENVLAPARLCGEVKIYAHFFRQKEIDNPRSGEVGELDTEEYRLLNPDWLQLEEPDTCLSRWNFEAIKGYGDHYYWNDGFRSMRNLMHQLHSLHEATGAVLADDADLCLFCRPDLRYHDSLGRHIQRGTKARHDLVQVPYWQPWHGLNDRFAIVTGREAIAAYGQRILLAQEFCQLGPQPLHAESLLKYAISKAGVRVKKFPERASRVRLDGTQAREIFNYPGTWKYRQKYGINFDRIMRVISRL